MSDWIDISIPLTHGVTRWPGDPPFRSRKVASMGDGDEANVTAFSMCAHTGTHIDAPLHYFAKGKSVDALAMEILMGPATVRGIDEECALDRRVLFRSRNSDREWWREPYRDDFAALTPEHARKLVSNGTKLVGIDYLSVGNNSPDGAKVHRILLRGGVVILEGLNLTAVAPGLYDLVCLPLRLEGAEGAPARALIYPKPD